MLTRTPAALVACALLGCYQSHAWSPSGTDPSTAPSEDSPGSSEPASSMPARGIDAGMAVADDPDPEPERPHFIQVAAGAFSSCGLLASGEAVCWGMACGTPDPQRRDPVECFGRSCELDASGAATCSSFGRLEGAGLDGTEVAPDGHYTALEITQDFGCGLREDGTLSCWGVPLVDPGSTRFARFALGFCLGCGLRAQDGRVRCPHTCGAPILPPPGAFVELSVGDRHACALRADGTLACWGAGEVQRFTAPGGNNDCPSFPHACGQAAPPPGIFVAVAAGRYHSCALDRAGEAVCWGLGTRDDGCDFDTFECGQALPPAGPFTALAAGAAHTCGLREDGSVECWGAGREPRACGATDAGRDPQCGQSAAPEGRFVALSAGHFHTCALDGEGAIRCWGLGSERGACFDSTRSSAFDFRCGQALPPALPPAQGTAVQP